MMAACATLPARQICPAARRHRDDDAVVHHVQQDRDEDAGKGESRRDDCCRAQLVVFGAQLEHSPAAARKRYGRSLFGGFTGRCGRAVSGSGRRVVAVEPAKPPAYEQAAARSAPRCAGQRERPLQIGEAVETGDFSGHAPPSVGARPRTAGRPYPASDRSSAAAPEPPHPRQLLPAPGSFSANTRESSLPISRRPECHRGRIDSTSTTDSPLGPSTAYWISRWSAFDGF